MAFIARYPGECAKCGKRFRKGAFIQYDEKDKVQHVGDCDDATDDAPTGELEEREYDRSEYAHYEEVGRKPAGVCGKCFLVHAGECM